MAFTSGFAGFDAYTRRYFELYTDDLKESKILVFEKYTGTFFDFESLTSKIVDQKSINLESEGITRDHYLDDVTIAASEIVLYFKTPADPTKKTIARVVTIAQS